MKINRFLLMFCFMLICNCLMSFAVLSVNKDKMPVFYESNLLEADIATECSAEIDELGFNTVTVNSDVRVFFPESGSVEVVDIEEYTVGVLMGEMYDTAPIEALKALSVAIRSYTLYMCELNVEKNYDVTADSSVSQAYMNREDAVSVWGELGNKKYEIMQEAVLRTHGQVLMYDSDIICALYHASSYPLTEDSGNVFLESLPYLSGGVRAEEATDAYISEVSYTLDDFNAIISSHGCEFYNIENLKFENIKNENGRCNILRFFDDEASLVISGREVRELFGLRSTSFDVKIDDGVNFVVRGFGHGVGLSQNGASLLAEKGKGYEEILYTYYKDTELYKTIYK